MSDDSEVFIDGFNDSPFRRDLSTGFNDGRRFGSTEIQDMMSVYDSMSGSDEESVGEDKILGYVEGGFKKRTIGDFLPEHNEETFGLYRRFSSMFKSNSLFYNDDRVGYLKRFGNVSREDVERSVSRSDLLEVSDGWNISLNRSRHQLIFGKTRTGKSVCYSRVMILCLDSNWTVFDLHDSGGRLECAPMIFSLDDSKLRSIVRNKWDDIGLDSESVSRRVLRDIRKLKERCDLYHDKDEYSSRKVKYYHPYVHGIPDEVPDLDNLEFNFFAIGVSDLFDLLDSDVMDHFFDIFGESLSSKEKEMLHFVRAYFKSLGDTDKSYRLMSLDDVVSVLAEWRDSEEEVSVPVGSGNRTVSMNFSDVKTMDLVRKISKIDELGLFQPSYFMEEGEVVRNDRIIDINSMLEDEGCVHAFTTKWARTELKYIIVSYILERIYKLKSRGVHGGNVFIGSREINELVPSRPKGIEFLTSRKFEKLISRGADLGIRVVGDAQQVMSVSRDFKRNVHVITTFRLTDSSEKDELKRSLSKYLVDDNFRERISYLSVGECFITSRSRAAYLNVIPPPTMSKIEGVDMMALLAEYADNDFIKVDKSDLGDTSFGITYEDDVDWKDDDGVDRIEELRDSEEIQDVVEIDDGDEEDDVKEEDISFDDRPDSFYDMDKVDGYECPEFLRYHSSMNVFSGGREDHTKVFVLGLVYCCVNGTSRVSSSDLHEFSKNLDSHSFDDLSPRGLSQMMNSFTDNTILYRDSDFPASLFLNIDLFTDDRSIDDEFYDNLSEFIDNLCTFMVNSDIHSDFVDDLVDNLLS